LNSYGSILVVGYQKTPLLTFVEQLQEIQLDEYLQIKTCTVDEFLHFPINEKTLVLVTSEIVLTMIKPFLKKETPFIIAKRTINYYKVREILELPKDTRILLVGNMKEAAEETALVLEELGLNLDYQLYYLGEKYDPTIKFAITPGSIDFVPSSIEHIIDIGTRFIDISSIIEILSYFKIPNAVFKRLSARYVQSLIHITSELNQEIYTTKLLRNNLQEIVNNVDDAVLLFTKEGSIDVINQKAVELLNLQRENIIGKKIGAILDSTFIEAIKSIENNIEIFKDIDRIAYYIRKKEIYVERQFIGTLILFRKANEIQKIEYNYRNKTKNQNFHARYTFKHMVTKTKSILDMIEIAKKLSKSDSTILILGETGTGKEILAQAIHNASPRSYNPFVGVNFAALSETLLESELFGYEGGAFTGARKDGRSGLFEQAHKGTIFLDEIGDASPSIQNRLLRVLQEKQILRVGGEQIISVDVRVVAATNKDLEQLIEDGEFREDLFYRLNILPIYLPPLRERVEDISLLTHLFVEEFSRKLDRKPFRFSDTAMKALKEYPWPGNIRELRGTIEYLAHIVDDEVFKEKLPFFSKKRMMYIHEDSDQVFEKLNDLFQSKGFLNDIATILTLLQKESYIGRHVLMNALEKVGVYLSEQQFRYRQKLLRDAELISVHLGRKGTVITERGKSFLDYYNKKHYK
jgi:transcriptional regulator with PAS, ATPase and Fis domain